MTERKSYRWVAWSTRAAVGLGSLALAATIVILLVSTKPKLESVDQQQPPPPVQVIRATPVMVQRQWRGYGTANAMDSADVPTRVTTTVQQIPVEIEPGGQVKQGQLLVSLDPSDFARQMEIAENNLREIEAQIEELGAEHKNTIELLDLSKQDVALAEVELTRVQEVFNRGAGNPQDQDRAKRELIAAQRTRITNQRSISMIDSRRTALDAKRTAQMSTLRQAKEDVARCSIVSPIDGAIESLDVEVGEHVSNGARIARVVSLRRIEVPLRLPASARADVRSGDAVSLVATNETDRHWQAAVTRIGPADDVATRTVTIYVEMNQDPASAALLSPGQFVQALVTGGDARRRWVVPERSVRGNRLSIVDHQRVSVRPVEVDFLLQQQFSQFGLPNDQWAALRTALAPGELVIVNPSQSITQGRHVTPIVLGVDQTAEKEQPEQSG